MSDKKVQDILPKDGIWTIEGLADYLGLPGSTVQQTLTDLGVPTIRISGRYKHRLFRLEDLRGKIDVRQED